jgi:hypothetical protein
MRWPASLMQIACPHIIVWCALNVLQKLAAICMSCATHIACCKLLLTPAALCRQLAQLTNQLGYLTETTLRKLAGLVWNTCHLTADEG